jgi:2-polyprenyl-3-methyl-5-hydroxy-6-metoxy-1,4-benzoquinol methylase
LGIKEELSIVLYQLRSESDVSSSVLKDKYFSFFNKTISDKDFDKTVKTLKFERLVELESFVPTLNGKKAFQKINRDYFFAFGLEKSSRSKCESEYCNKVNENIGITQSITDWEELDTLISLITREKGQMVIDLGCGIGTITEIIASRTEKNVIGIDISKKAINSASNLFHNNNLSFICSSIEEYIKNIGNDCLLVSIDSFYFVKTIELIINVINEKKAKAFIFWSTYISDIKDPSLLSASNSDLGKILESLNIKYKCYDFTKNEARIWDIRKKIILEMKADYRNEGNEYLWFDRSNEIELINRICEDHLNSRYLFSLGEY